MNYKSKLKINKMTKEEAIQILKRHSLNIESCTNHVIAALNIAIQRLEAQGREVSDEEIEKYAKQFPISDQILFTKSAKWMRKLLTNK
jgi:hypothetical protein